MEAVGGVDVPPEAGHSTAIALDFSAGEPSSSMPAKVPRRIRRRLLECRSSPPSSVEEIEAKLKDADLRRRQFHEWLSSRARPKARSPSWSSQEEDLGQRIEAKLIAAEQKRLSLLANAQMRLARLDELRQAAKTGAEIRSEKQREQLGTRVESRVQKAEANRMRLLKAHMQRHAAVQERKARSMLQRIVQENKYKEHILWAISQKRSAAERKRMVLLEAEKTRAQARVMQARRVAKAICFQRESERRILKEQLELRLQRAKQQRAEFLRLRGNSHNSSRVNLIKHGDLLSRKLAWCWRKFVRSRKTTFTLAHAYETLGINENSVKSMPFDRLARVIESATTIQTVKDLLDRLESRFLLYQSSNSCSPENIDHLLSRLASPRKKTPPSKKSRAVAKKGSSKISSSGSGKLSRYPVRAVLCAYMILGHPNAVFSEQGEREVALTKAASDFAREFELLMKVILDGASIVHIRKQPSPDVMLDESKYREECAIQSPPAKSFRSQLSIFDDVWCSYLYCFVVWKVKDARLLEDDIVRAACQLELSMMQTCKLTSKGEMPRLSHDLKAIQEQVIEDQKLLREKVEHLSGNEGLQRMEYALSGTRAMFFEAKESGTPLVSHGTPLSSPTVSSAVKPVDPLPKEESLENMPSSNHVVRSLFGGALLGPKPGTIYQLPSSQLSSKVDRQPQPSENELLVNEIVHGRSSFTNEFEMTYGSNIKVIEDQKLLREKVEHLSGNEGLQRMEYALSGTRARFFEAKESGTPLVSHGTLSSPTVVCSAVKPVDPLPTEESLENMPSSNHVVRSLFGGASLGPKPGTIYRLPSSQLSSKVDRQPPSENELLVNEIVHGRSSFTNEFEKTYGSNIKAKVKETMEKAFWDVILESMKEDSPDYGRIIGLVQEVRDELSEIAPLSWKQDIHNSIDLDILSQVMELETQDKDYLGSVLEYALLTTRKLSAPSNEDDLKKAHEKLLNDLTSIAESDGQNKLSFTIAMIKGLRFVLEQIQTLKKEISKTRIQMIEPIIKGSAGLEYLQKTFEDRYGPPSSAVDSLYLTTLWISPLKNIADEEWNEYVDSLSVLSESHAVVPVKSLRTGGGNVPQEHKQSPHLAETRGDEQPGCTGEKLDVLLRLGLLKLASSVEGLIADTVPETFQLNVLRLRFLQSQLQQIMVISTGILVLRQVVISEHLTLSSTELDIVVSDSVKSLSKLLDHEPDISIEEIIEALAGFFPEDEKLQIRKQLMARLLTKSLGKEDPVFRKIYHSVYLATRAVLFGGSGTSGRRLAQGILQKVGAAMLLDRVVRVAELLIFMARVSIQVHGPWYGSLV